VTKLDTIAIRNTLSIRYDPTKKSSTKLISWRDFRKQTSDSKGIITEKLLKNSIIKKIPSTTESIAVSLSGGIDSALCLAILRKVFPKKKIFAICGVFEGGFEESKFARQIAKKFDAQFHVIRMDSIFTNMPEIISITGTPRWNTYTHLVAKAAQKFSNVLVTGDGADEMFGGYSFRYNKFLNLYQPNDDWKIKTIKYLECHNRDWVPDQEHMFGSAIKFDWNEIYKYFQPYFSNSLEPLQQVMLADFNGKLVFDFIPTSKSISRKYQLKGVPIFLDSNLISFAMGLPLSQKFDKKTLRGKLVLRAITKRFGIKHIDEKRGFSPSLFFDWKKYGKKIFQKYLLDKNANIFQKKLINKNWTLRAFETMENDGDIRYLNRLTSILALEIWLRIFITKEMKAGKKL